MQTSDGQGAQQYAHRRCSIKDKGSNRCIASYSSQHIYLTFSSKLEDGTVALAFACMIVYSYIHSKLWHKGICIL